MHEMVHISLSLERMRVFSTPLPLPTARKPTQQPSVWVFEFMRTQFCSQAGETGARRVRLLCLTTRRMCVLCGRRRTQTHTHPQRDSIDLLTSIYP